jgi:hypothetical protein
MPYRVPRPPTEQAAYNREQQAKFSATRRVAPSGSGPGGTPPGGDSGAASGADLTVRLKELAELHTSGALNDDEFTAAKAKVLGSTPPSS